MILSFLTLTIGIIDVAWMVVSLLAMFSILSFIRSEEHTSELQSLVNLVCRLLLEKKKT